MSEIGALKEIVKRLDNIVLRQEDALSKLSITMATLQEKLNHVVTHTDMPELFAKHIAQCPGRKSAVSMRIVGLIGIGIGAAIGAAALLLLGKSF